MFQVAIDGPAGAGKSSIAKAAAKELGFIYIDTGAMYRAIGLKATLSGVELSDSAALERMAQSSKISLECTDDGQKIYLDGENVTEKIRTPEISMAASRVSAIEGVRKALVERQRDIAADSNVIMDGRDIGTVVLPKAQVKIFLTASSAARAERRCKELTQKGMAADFETVKREIEERDKNDMTRAASPLVKAPDAQLIDTTELDLEESIKAVTDHIRNELKK